MTAGNDFDPEIEQPKLFSALLTPHRSLSAPASWCWWPSSASVSFAAGLAVPADGCLAVFASRPRCCRGLLGIPGHFSPRQGDRGKYPITAVRTARAPVSHRGHVVEWVLNRCGWRLDQKTHPNSASKNCIWYRAGRRVSVASFLGADEKQVLPKR